MRGRSRFSRSARGRGDRNLMPSVSSFDNANREVTIAWGELYREGGILQRRSSTRSGVDKSSFGNAGNGMRDRMSFCSRGADPPKNELGRAGALIFRAKSCRDVNAGNGFIFISRILFKSAFGMSKKSISHTRLWCLSAEMMLFASCGFDIPRRPFITIGNSGQIASAFCTGLLFVKTSRSRRRCGEANTMDRHGLHT